MRWLVVIALTVGCGSPSPPPVVTTPIVSSPGPLIASHAQLVCTDCHYDDNSPVIAVAKCSGCHTALGVLVAADCLKCHMLPGDVWNHAPPPPSPPAP
jgi:hypothetical protein